MRQVSFDRIVVEALHYKERSKKEIIMAEVVKVTQKDIFARIAERCADDPEIVELCEKKIAQLSKPRKPRENTAVMEFRQAVMSWLAEQDGPVTNAMCKEAMGESSQKTANALNWLAANGHAVKHLGETSKEKATYTIA